MSFADESVSKTISKSVEASRAASARTVRETLSRPVEPTASFTTSGVMRSRPPAHSSSRLIASRIPPCASLASISAASCSRSIPSHFAIYSSRAVSTGTGIRLKSNRWQRETMVAGNFCSSVVASMNITCAGGSSSVLRSALKALCDSMCTSSIM